MGKARVFTILSKNESNTKMHDYLKKIIANKQKEISQIDLASYAKINTRSPRKSFKETLLRNSPAIIAEIKRRSPSKGDLASIADVSALALQYAQGGAAAISVLTDAEFGGSLKDLQQVATVLQASETAVLRKDFVLESIQIEEAILTGADAILLIVAILKEKTVELLRTANQLGIETIVEVHNLEELKYALSIDAQIIGVNNRNLTSFTVDPNIALQLKSHIPQEVLAIAESGIQTPDEAKIYIDAGYHALLIGESLVTHANPKQFLQQMRAAL